MATKTELEAENARLRAQMENSTPNAGAPADVNALTEGQTTDVADRSGSFIDATGVTHTYDEGDTIVYDANDNGVRVIGADDVNGADEPTE